MTQTRTVEVAEELDVAADLLWHTISDFEHIDRWSNLKIRSIDGNDVGCRRTVEMESGVLVTERLLLRDSQHMRYTYEVVAPNPYPMLDYRSTMSIEKIAQQRCRLHWIGYYTPAEGTDPTKTDKLMNKVYTGGIALLRRHFAQVRDAQPD
jgi:hypothetical protein